MIAARARTLHGRGLFGVFEKRCQFEHGIVQILSKALLDDLGELVFRCGCWEWFLMSAVMCARRMRRVC